MQSPRQLDLLHLRHLQSRNALNISEMPRDQNGCSEFHDQNRRVSAAACLWRELRDSCSEKDRTKSEWKNAAGGNGRQKRKTGLSGAGVIGQTQLSKRPVMKDRDQLV
jgi:hypothetical protein